MVPRVSVVMPVRDGGRHLEPAVRSVLDQDLRELELVVVDDGSTDGTPGVLARLSAGDPRLRVLSRPPRGYVDALRDGVDAARADVVARLDADDLALPSRLRRQLEVLDADPGVVLVGAAVQEVDGQDRVLRTPGPGWSPPTTDAELRAALRTGNPFTHSTVAFRRAAYVQVGGYRPALRPSEDSDLWLRLSEVGRLAALPEVLVRYRLHAGQVSVRDPHQMAVAAVAAAVAGEHRRDGRPDPLADVGRVDDGLLAALGVPASRVAEREVELLLWLSRHSRGLHVHQLRLQALRAAGGSTQPARARVQVLRQAGTAAWAALRRTLP
ncbi:MAG: glycosyl transferase family 2 [Frankiales bacterium]|nr:glycosyl transferase family 2 [Frankiales bacterium]